MVDGTLELHAGEIVEVRSLDEILATLDGGGKLDALPFMPEMVGFCGRRFRVRARVERTCVDNMAKRRMDDAVWLEDVRCSGAAHEQCQMGCLLFWKEAWLKRVDGPSQSVAPPAAKAPAPWPYPVSDAASGAYICQSTSLPQATKPLTRWQNAFTHVKDLYFGHFGPVELVKILFIFASLRVFGRYGRIRQLWGRRTKTPTEALGLRPGELVEVKTPEEIEQTLDARGRNRGMCFTWDCVQFCGGRYEVATRFERFIDETTGKLRKPENSVLLKNVKCPGIYRRGCMRDTNIIWREVWLRRVTESK